MNKQSFKMGDTNLGLEANPTGPLYDITIEAACIADDPSDWLAITMVSPEGTRYNISIGVQEGKPMAFIYHPADDACEPVTLTFGAQGINLSSDHRAVPQTEPGGCFIKMV